MKTTGHIDIDKPIAEVFTYTTENPEEWGSIIVSDEIINETPDIVGTTFRTVTEEHGKQLTFEGTITANDPPNSHSSELVGKQFDIDITQTFEALDDNRTRFTQISEVHPKGFLKIVFALFGWMMNKSNCDALDKELQVLKKKPRPTSPPTTPANMRPIFLLPYLLLVTCNLSLAGESASPARTRPNIVFLLTDDQTTYSLGCYGNPDVKTPNIDALASQGMTFDNHYVTTAICMASRVNIMTGKFEYRTGCNFEHGNLLRSHWQNTYPVLLRNSGYTTAFAGKFGFVVSDAPKSKGTLPESDFDRWGGGPGQTNYQTSKNKSMAAYAKDYPHSSRSYGAFSRDFIHDAAKSDKPFCLSISFKAPHMPATPDPLDDDVYRGKTFTKPANYGRGTGKHFSSQSKQGRQYERFHSWGYADKYDKVMATYNQQIFAVDIAVGMVCQALEETGTADNTVIIFTSDKGFLCGSHGYGSKVLPYEESARVPLIIVDPRSKNATAGKRTDALTGNVDFHPTILALAGLDPLPDTDGRNLLPLLEDPDNPTLGHDHLPLINVWGPDPCHALGVVTRDYKYIFWSHGAADFTPTAELFHLSGDPLELADVDTDPAHAIALAQMQTTYDSAVAHWRDHAVPYHNYKNFATLFDRHLTWPEKQAALAASQLP